MNPPGVPPELRFDSTNGLLRDTDDQIVLFRRIADTENAGPNNFRKGLFGLRTSFHGYAGVYGGNTPRSLDAYKNLLPHLQTVILPPDTAVENHLQTSNITWAGRAAGRLILKREPEPATSLVVVQPAPPFSLKDNASIVDGQPVDAAWVIVPPALYESAHKRYD